ncbi:hypothetical protein [Paraclostridium bifermentans]|uniref:hypothetical protein n=1 Tax=Paraclostridium bifermentans TaxID=1490 RepID=UPI001158CC56|nr:hypothetical protein [Paraclostridium bifermentans]TQO55610.1 hypothetical protein D5S05_17505 [Paraclostridium bifermentans]
MNFNENIEIIKNKNQYNIWYFVKQETDFIKVCEAVSVLEEFKDKGMTVGLKEFIESGISSNYRILSVARMYGLIRKTSLHCVKEEYKYSILTDVYYEIKKRCNGNFRDIDSYYEIMEQQIEKIYISSILDENFETDRKDSRIYPLFLLYKVLIEMGRSYGNYKISYDEFICFLATAGKYSDYSKVIYTIMVDRDNSIKTSFSTANKSLLIREDLRYHLALKNLKHLNIDVDNNIIELDKRYINKVESKVLEFENKYFRNKLKFDEINQETYIENLCKNISIFDI